MALSGEEKLILSAVVILVMALVLFFELKIMRGKAKQVRRISQRKDEAHNAVLTTRSVMNVLEREGADVSKARAMVDRARDLMARGEYGRTMDLCDSARAELMKCRHAAPEPAGGEDDLRDELDKLAKDIVGSDSRPSSSEVYKGTKLPVEEGSGYLSAKFELNTATDEVAQAASEGRPVADARALVGQAKAEFDSGDYSKALSLAVRARKSLSSVAASDTIPLRKPPRAEVEEEVEDIAGSPDGDKVEMRCVSCNGMVLPDDTFCGTCGAPSPRERKCPDCGRVAKAGDRFCRKCGSNLS